LNLSCGEILTHADQPQTGEVTNSRHDGCFPPRLHNTWRQKQGGRAHNRYWLWSKHLMLDMQGALAFIAFIEAMRPREQLVL